MSDVPVDPAVVGSEGCGYLYAPDAASDDSDSEEGDLLGPELMGQKVESEEDEEYSDSEASDSEGEEEDYNASPPPDEPDDFTSKFCINCHAYSGIRFDKWWNQRRMMNTLRVRYQTVKERKIVNIN